MKMKNVINNCLRGIGIAAVISSAISISHEVSNGGVMESSAYYFTKMVLASIAIGIGWGAPVFLYDDEKRSALQSAVLHILTGCTVMMIASCAAGWIPTEKGLPVIGVVIAVQIGTALLIWLFMYQRNKKLAEKMNARVQELNRESD